MALKRSRSLEGASSSTLAFDNSRFVSMEAQARYELLKTKALLQERNLYFGENTRYSPQRRGHDIVYYTEIVKVLGWETFYCDLPDVAPELIFEFFANLPEATNNSCMVRRKFVNYSPQAINAYYELPDGVEDEIDDAELSDEKVCDVLTVGVGVGNITKSGTVTMTNFTRDARFWRIFLAHNIHPTSQDHEVRRESQRLLYRIVLHKKIDVGKEIHNKLASWKIAAKQRLPYPHLIMGLCLGAGVTIPLSMPLLKAPPPYDRIYVFSKIRVSEAVKERDMTCFGYHYHRYRGGVDSFPPSQPLPSSTSCGQRTGNAPSNHLSEQPLEVTMASLSRQIRQMMRYQTISNQWYYRALTAAGYTISPPPDTPPSTDNDDAMAD